MAELKDWGNGTKRAASGLMIVWVIGTVLGLLLLLVMLGWIISL